MTKPKVIKFYDFCDGMRKKNKWIEREKTK